MSEDPQNAYNNFELLFEKVINYFDQDPVLSKEIIKAKDEYFKSTGKIKEHDADFANRMNCFLLWFAFDWRSPTFNETPLSYFQEKAQKSIQQSENEQLERYKKHIHSLFNFVKQKNGVTIVQDVFSGKKHAIMGNQILIGHIRGSLFETRIFKQEDIYFFSNYFIHHPVEVKKNIVRMVKHIKKQRNSIKPFLLKLHSFHTKWTHYRNIDIKSIYHFDSSVPEAK